MIPNTTILKKVVQNGLFKQKQYIDYGDYLNKENSINVLKEQGFKFINKKNKIKLIVGLSCLGIALFPNGLGIVFYPLSFYFLGIGIIDLKHYKEIGIKKLKWWLK